MGVAKVSVLIERSPADVYAVLSHVENVLKWNRNAIEVTMLTPGPMRVGSRRRVVARTFGGGTQVNEAEMAELVPNERMVVRSVSGPFDWRADIQLQDVPEGTLLDWTWTFERPRGVYGLISPMLPSLMRREFQRDLEDLKRLMETGAL